MFARRSTCIIWLCAALGLVLHLAYSSGASLWCDEVIWLMFGAKDLSHLITSVRNEYGPLGFFEPLIIAVFAKPLLWLGVDNELAFRAAPSVLASCIPLLVLASKTFTAYEKSVWSFLTALSVPCLAAAITARHPASLLFFSSVSVVAAVDILRRKAIDEKISPSIWLSALLLCVAGFAYPYTLGYSVVLLFLAVFFISTAASQELRNHKFILIALFCLGIGLKFLWFKVLRTNAQLSTLPWSYTLNLSHHDFTAVKESWLFALGGPFASNKLGPIVFVVGVLIRGYKAPKEAVVLLCTMLAMLLGPYLMSHHYAYSYSPRQALGATPIWIYFQVVTTSALIEICLQNNYKIYARAASAASILLFLGFCVFKPLWHFHKNIPPFVDMPRYDLSWLQSIPEGDALVVLSACQEGVASLYRNQKTADEFFKHYAEGAGVEPPYVSADRHEYLWTRDVISCGGKIPQEPDNKELLAQLEKYGWGRVHVLAPANYVVPNLLKQAHCRTETNKNCRYE